MTLEAIALSKAEAADALSVSSRTISYLIADGTLAARKLGARTLIDVESLRAYWASLPRGAGAPLPCTRRAAKPRRARRRGLPHSAPRSSGSSAPKHSAR
jgi:excisionase family DNA binding protein